MKTTIRLLIIIILKFTLGCANNINSLERKELKLIGIRNQDAQNYAIFKDNQNKFITISIKNSDLDIEIKEFHTTYLIVSARNSTGIKEFIWKVGEQKIIYIRGQNET